MILGALDGLSRVGVRFVIQRSDLEPSADETGNLP